MLIKVTMASSAEEFMSFKLENRITVSYGLMFYPPIERILDAKFRAIAMNTPRLAMEFS